MWRALTNAAEFGAWFGSSWPRRLRKGVGARSNHVSGYEHLTLEMIVERIEPEHYFAYRWHPHAVDPKADYSQEPTTLVEFRLEETADGTLLTITESGFDRIPLARRAEAFRSNDGGWTQQVANIERHVAQP